jgi:predicted amidohydrolase YtcJ
MTEGEITLILVNGQVLTPVTPDSPTGYAQAVAVAGERIAAVGDSVAIRDLAGPRTRVIDLRRRLALPGFADAHVHVHAIAGGLESLRCNLMGLKTRAATLDAITVYADRLPPDSWVLGGGWSLEAFAPGMPSADDLDRVCGGRPAYLPNRDHHSAWVNSRALDIAGIGWGAPDPPDGRIERGADGRPSGALHEGAMGLVGCHVSRPTRQELSSSLEVAQRYLHSLGITSWQDAAVGESEAIGVVDTYDTYRTAATDGSLTASVVGALWWDRTRGMEQMPEFLGRRESASTGRFQATSVKMMLDGVCETFTAAMTEPYVVPEGVGQGQGRHQHKGDLFIDPAVVADAVEGLSLAGFQVHFHAIGDRAVSVALDAIAGLPTAQRVARRHHLAHLQFIRPGDVERFAQTGAIANFQPLWACRDPQMEDLTIPFVGEQRAAWQYRIGSLAARGAAIAFGSDWPVSSPDPMQGIHVAVNRRLSTRLGRAGTPETETALLPAEAVSVLTAVEAYTRGVAYVNHADGDVGVIAPGLRADMAVLDQDLFAIPPGEIGDTSVELTIARGQVVYGGE